MKLISFLSAAVSVVAITIVTPSWAAGQSSPNYKMPRDSVSAGAQPMTSAQFKLYTVLGDSVSTRTLSGVQYLLGNGFRGSVSPSPAVLTLLSAVSTKLHGTTPFNVDINLNESISGNVSVEPRFARGGIHTLVFHFDMPVASIGAVQALDAALQATQATFAIDTNGDAVVTITHPGDNRRLAIHLNGVNGGTNVSVAMGFLVGDANQTRKVTSADIAGLKANINRPLVPGNYRFDLNVDGSISQADLTIAKSRTGSQLAP